MTTPEFTADQIEIAIVDALKNRDIQAVPSLIRLLALQAPSRARDILDAIQIGIFLQLEDKP